MLLPYDFVTLSISIDILQPALEVEREEAHDDIHAARRREAHRALRGPPRSAAHQRVVSPDVELHYFTSFYIVCFYQSSRTLRTSGKQERSRV